MRREFRPEVEHAERRLLTTVGCKWPTGVVKYYIEPDVDMLGRAETLAAFDAALDAWEAVARIDLSRVEDPSQANVTVREVSLPTGLVTVLGYTYLPSRNRRTSPIPLTINQAAAQTFPSLKRLYEHEVGHTLGLNHLGPRTVMAPYENGVTDLTGPDIRAIRQLYGTRK